jgi:hypothetical protein
MKLKERLRRVNDKVEDLYLVEISEGSTIAYLTKYNNEYDFTASFISAWLFPDTNTIPQIPILKGLYYNIISFNTLYTPRYNIRYQDKTIITTTTWGHPEQPDNKTLQSAATNNFQTAVDNLEYFKYLKIHDLQQEIMDVSRIKIYESKLGS